MQLGIKVVLLLLILAEPSRQTDTTSTESTTTESTSTESTTTESTTTESTTTESTTTGTTESTTTGSTTESTTTESTTTESTTTGTTEFTTTESTTESTTTESTTTESTTTGTTEPTTTESTTTESTTTESTTTESTTTTATTTPTTTTRRPTTTTTQLNLHPNPSINQICPTNPEMNDRLRNKALDMHNYRRSQLAKGLVTKNNGNALPSATDMIKLKYSCNEERTAINVVSKCAKSPTVPDGVKQNFYLVPKNQAQYRMNATELAIKNWWSQVRLQSVNIGMAVTLKEHHIGTPIMSFIKMAWAATTEIGCAVSEKQLCGTNWAVLCRYRTGPFGANMHVYTPGPTCSSCAATCDNALCVK